MTKKFRKPLIDNGNKIVIDFIFVYVSNLLETGNGLSIQSTFTTLFYTFTLGTFDPKIQHNFLGSRDKI